MVDAPRPQFWQQIAVNTAALAPFAGCVEAWQERDPWALIVWPFGWVAAAGIYAIAEWQRRWRGEKS